jgi:AcrR family transcriptional regulator
VPKIIENVREQLLAEAKKQVFEHGYAATTIRSVARACGVGVGTVYNYFSSKEMLVATFVYEDWKDYLSNMQLLPNNQPRILLEGIYNGLRSFAAQNQRLFSDSDAVKLVAVGASGRHKMLRDQIAGIILPICKTDFCAEFIAEALICWSMQDVDFDAVYTLLEKIIK